MNLALSTSWNAFRYENGKDVIREIRALGFSAVELSFDLTAPMVEEVSILENVGQVEVNSVHNFCPIPDGIERKVALPDYYSLASLDNEERQLAIKFTKRSIDTAQRMKARALVLHLGRIEIQDKTKVLMRFFNNGKRDSKEFMALQELMKKERAEVIQPYFASAQKSLEELSLYARDRGIGLGIENRYYFREIPSFEEIGIILDCFGKNNVFYWHDVGHAQVWENLGFHSSIGFLEKYSDKLLGIHLHDVIDTDDHRAPLKGNIDFSKMVPFLKRDTIKVMEAHYPASTEDIKNGASYLEEIFRGIKDD